MAEHYPTCYANAIECLREGSAKTRKWEYKGRSQAPDEASGRYVFTCRPKKIFFILK